MWVWQHPDAWYGDVSRYKEMRLKQLEEAIKKQEELLDMLEECGDIK